MWRPTALISVLLIAIAPAFARVAPDDRPPSSVLTLDNGMQIILIPNSAAPLITSVVVVRAGSERETPETNGIAHMLEHLLFNGTTRRTEVQIEDEQDRYGIVNNASTRGDHTAFFVMATRDQFARALDLQADMLFSSTIPQDKLAKERGIIINEIAKDRVADSSVMDDLYASRLYSGTSLALPIIGSPETVSSIGREAILAYYHAWYVPNNMTAIIMGDFTLTEIEALVRRSFSAVPPGLLPAAVDAGIHEGALGRTHSRRTTGTDRMLALATPAPGIRTASFGTAYLLAALLDRDLRDDVNARLKRSGAPGSFVSAGVGYEPRGSTATFHVSGSLDPKADWAAAAEALRAEIIHRASSSSSSSFSSGGGKPWTRESLSVIRLEERSSLTRLWEKPHYFGLDRAPYIACCGWDFTRDLLLRLEEIDVADLKSVSARLLTGDAWATLMVGPDAPADTPPTSQVTPPPPRAPTTPAREEPAATPESRAASPPPSAPTPSGLSARSGATGGTNTRLVLNNGLTLSIDFTDDSRVFAAHVLLKNRCAAEPAGKAGIVEMMHRMAASGTRPHPGTTLAQALSSIGATLKVTDDAAVPYDDIYLSPEYSYIRFESLDEFADQAVTLLAEILSDPDLANTDALAAAREQLVARARQANASPRDRARRLLARGLWGEKHPLAAPLFGTEEAIRSINSSDLVAFHKTYFSPRNMIIGIATSVPREKLLTLLDASLGRWPDGGAASPPPAAGPAEPRNASLSPLSVDGSRLMTEPIDAAQAYLMFGRLIPVDPNVDAEAPAISALAAVLSRRMGDLLREKRGLSYSLGADSGRMGDSLQFSIFMGVLPGSVGEARTGIHEVLARLVSDPPGQQEVDDAIRSTRLRTLMRGLSRINRAYGRCMEELRDPARGSEGSERTSRGSANAVAPAAVTAEQVLLAARRLLAESRLAGWVEAVVGGAPEPRP